MRKSTIFTPLLLGVVGAAVFAPLAASAQPPCTPCFYPYRDCMRAAVTQEDQTLCEEEYARCVEATCPGPTLSRLAPFDRRDPTALATRVVRPGLMRLRATAE